VQILNFLQLGKPFKEDEIGGVCSVYGRDERCIHNFGQKIWRDETTWKTRV